MNCTQVCPCCGLSDCRVLYRKKDNPQILIGLPDTTDVAECNNCKTAFTCPMPSKDQLDRIYSDVFFYSSDFSGADARGHRKYIDQIETMLGSKGKLLDIGCASGLLLSLADEGGWETYGIDISEKLLEAAGSRVPRASLFNGQIEDAPYENGFFDAVVALNLLEHLVTPVRLLSEVSRVLKPGGIFLFKTVIIDSIPGKKRKVNWDHLKWPGHLIWYSKESLVTLLNQSGFRARKTRVTGVPYIPGVKRYMDHRSTKNDSTETRGSSEKPDRAETSMPFVKKLLKAILRSSSLKTFASFINSTFKLGDTVTVYAERNSDHSADMNKM